MNALKAIKKLLSKLLSNYCPLYFKDIAHYISKILPSFNNTSFKDTSYWRFLCKWQVASYTIVQL